MEKGDFFVLIALFVLGLIFIYPFYQGHNVGAREKSSLQALLALRRQCLDLGLVGKLEETGDSIAKIPGLRPQDDSPRILMGTDATVLWRDGSYDYAIRILGFMGSGPALLVGPDRPGETGTRQFTWSPGSELTARPMKDTPATGDPDIIAAGERKAQRLAEAIVTVLAEAGLDKLVGSLVTNRPTTLIAIPEREFGCLSPFWRDDNYLFRVSVAMTSAGLDLDLWAWPADRGRSGFDAFFASGRSIPAQSWNMASPYLGMHDLKSIPKPGAARNRTGAVLDSKDNWVGWDGKRWFAIDLEE